MGGVDREELEKALLDLESKIGQSTRELMRAELDNEIQASIVRELLYGERTLTELVEAIYSLSQGDEGYRTSYTRIRRDARDLEARGFVSRRLFGRDKPYHLTQLAVVKLTRIANTRSSWSSELVPKEDVVLYTAALCLLASYLVISRGAAVGSELVLLLFFSLSLFCGGMAFLRFLETLRRVM